MKRILNILLIALFGIQVACATSDNSRDVAEATALAGRLSGRLAEKVTFEKIAAEKGNDVFTLRNEGGRVVIGGNNANSMAVGLNRYLKKYCNVTVSWYSDIAVELPVELPQVKDERVTSRLGQRFFLNYCTYGYTMTYWGWREWERFIDWMALNGINLPLNITGQEAVWQKVWMKLGMTADETRNYFTGPSYLPWHRMANIDHWCGPLPQEWLDGQVELQKQILARERALNMRPVLPAFAGHVPGRIKELFPQADIKQLSPWQEFPKECLTYFLNSEDPMFAKIQRMFIEEQTALFGTDHIYGFDPFNEVDPPVWEPKYISRVTKHMYQSLAKVDKKAEWLLMAWFFFYNKNWTGELVEAMMKAVPKGRLTLLDYHCDNTEVWRMRNKFHGQNYLWCYLGDFGGNTVLQGNPKASSARLETALKEGGSNLRGIGSTLEGLDVQQMGFECMFERAWNVAEDNQTIVNSIADRHAGKANDDVRKAWEILYNDIYIYPGGNRGEMMNWEPTLDKVDWRSKMDVDYDKLLKAWKLLLKPGDLSRDAMKIDVIVVGRQLLDHKFTAEKEAFDKAFHNKDLAKMAAHATTMREILADVDKLCSTHRYCTMEKWIDLARSLGKTAETKDYYQMNATKIITTWGGNINDYANRSISGLISTYYAKRWELYFDEAFSAVKDGREFDKDGHHKRQQALDESYRYEPQGKDSTDTYDLLTLARLICEKYFD